MRRSAMQILITTALFVLFYGAARMWLSDAYLFGWMAHNWKVPLAVWLVALVLILAGRAIPSAAVTGGYLAGTIVGQYLGGWLLERKIAQITPDMDSGQVAQLHRHDGFAIWAVILVLCLAAGIAADILRRKRAAAGGGT